MSRLLRTLFPVTVIAAVLLGGVLAAPASAAADPGAEGDFVSRVNGARSGRGLGTLSTDDELTAIARRWSQRMANDGRLSHNPNLAREVTQDWEKLAENVGVGPSVEEIHNAFMNSAPHRANILDGAVTHIGVGVVVDPSGQIWVTQVFMRLRGGGGGAAPPPTTAAPPPTTTTTRPPRVTTTTGAPAPAPAPTAAPPPTVPRAPRSTTTAPPSPATTPTTEAAPPPPPEPVTPSSTTPPPTAAPTRRLVLVLDGLRELDRGR